MLASPNKKYSPINYICKIIFSYFIFLGVIAIFGTGYSSEISLIIVLLAMSCAVFFNLYSFKGLVFKKIDFFYIAIIILIQSTIGILHFDTTINPNYFTYDEVGVNMQTYYYDIVYFGYLMDMIASYRLEFGYLSADLASGVIHKNYFLAYFFSDLFYFGDAYYLNIMSLNILFLFYTAIIITMLGMSLYKDISQQNKRKIFYLCMLMPLAWIPSHTMRDILGAFVITLSIGLIYFASSNKQRVFLGFVSLILVFQHRSAYIISMLGSLLVFNLNNNRKNITNKIFTITFLIVIFSSLASFDIFKILLRVLNSSFNESVLSGTGIVGYLDHIFKMFVGPFPWTQYFNGSVAGYSAYYSSTTILSASWQLTIMYFLFMNIKTIFANAYHRAYFYIVALFALPAFFSIGGHNIYLLPSMILALPLLIHVKLSRFVFVFISTTCILIFCSIIFSTIKLIL